ncbi:hypothetical protein N7537_006909 [Penicillium hordei]|uniref:Acylphosphatase n=1 Tax=Penicillium hordei TaxID=40994 RepID=A0AAD6H3J3_9EURO|nr:uncharacterized protein N7537_006909 [Penicillium hordei]KAJ5603953.1 hypothetical protein N7537_006909 [Penicillium hordei]
MHIASPQHSESHKFPLLIFYLLQIAFKVHGTVQGVGFRDFTQKCAKLDGLKGWVRNTTCGRVEGEAQGSDEKVKKFLQRIDKGPSMAHVVKLEKRDLDVRHDEEGFTVMRTAESMFKPGN